MKIIMMLLALLFLPIVAYATPFLASNPSTSAITQVQVEIVYTAPGQSPVTTTEPGIYQVVGPDARLLDLAGKPAGQYTFRVRWAGVSGLWSDFSDPFDAEKPGKAGLRIVP